MKYIIIISFRESYKVDYLVFLLLDKLIKDYSIPRLIISNRDKLFISNY